MIISGYMCMWAAADDVNYILYLDMPLTGESFDDIKETIISASHLRLITL